LALAAIPPKDRFDRVTLNIFRIGRTWLPQREMLGYWLAPEIKEQVFEAIEKFVVENQIHLRLKRYGA
jgi:hypothetical protein